MHWTLTLYLCSQSTGYTQKNGVVSKVNKKFISHLTRAQHRQQWQLSKFLMRSQQFASHAYCGASFQEASQQEKALCVLHFEVSRSATRSPDLTPCNFFLWGFVKDSVYIPPLPMSLKELRDRITHALQTITVDMPPWVWDEFDYRVDVCCVTQGAHIEGLWLTHEKLGQLPLLMVYTVPV
jgi:hypothetical protein